MIIFNLSPRQSGKTSRIVNAINEIPLSKTVMLISVFKQLYEIKREHSLVSARGKTVDYYIYEYWTGKYDYVFIDEMKYSDNDVLYDLIIYLDNLNVNVYVEATLTEPPPEYFTTYLAQKYPEILI